MNELLTVLNEFNTYLKKGAPALLTEALGYYDNHMMQLDDNFFSEKINRNSADALTQVVNSILETLNIPENQKGRHTNLTVYELLKELVARKEEVNEQYKSKLTFLIKAINEKVKLRWEKIGLAGAIALIGIELGASFLGASYLQQIVTAVAFGPVVGIFVSIASAIYHLSPFTPGKKATVLERVRDGFFVLSQLALKLTTYALAITAAVAGLPVVSILTIVATGVGMLHQVCKLLQLKFQGRKRAHRDGNETLSTKQEDVRFENDYQKQKRALLIDLAVATLMVGLVAIWCFVPGGIFVGVGVIVAMGLTYLAQWKAQKYNEAIMRERLETTFDKIEEEDKQPSNRLERRPSGSELMILTELKAAPETSSRVQGGISMGEHGSNDVPGEQLPAPQVGLVDDRMQELPSFFFTTANLSKDNLGFDETGASSLNNAIPSRVC